jgi:beta-carotene 3-hydroxylase
MFGTLVSMYHAVPLFVGLVAVAFVAMEGVTYLTHRFVMHGVGVRLHIGHHRTKTNGQRFELNDLYPIGFGTLVCAALAVGFNLPGWSWLVPLCLGITAYGAAYAFVHDVATHGRLGRKRPLRSSLLRSLADAHTMHHRFNSEPYGMLLPIVPARLRQRAEASGSMPSQVPTDA